MNEAATEGERDRELWRRSPKHRPTIEDIKSDSLSSALATAHDALGWKEFEVAELAVKSAGRLAPDDPGVAALAIWIDAVRRGRPTPDDVDAMRRLSNATEAALMPTVLLIRMLLLMGDVSGADDVAHRLEGSTNLPSAEVARAQLLVGKGDTREGLEILQQLRTQWPTRSFALLTYEMILAASIEDEDGFRDAYVERCRLEETRPWSWLPWLWGRRLRIVMVALLVVWGIGAILNLPLLWLATAVLWVGYTLVHWHTLRSRSLTLRTALLGVGAVLLALAISVVYSLFG